MPARRVGWCRCRGLCANVPPWCRNAVGYSCVPRMQGVGPGWGSTHPGGAPPPSLRLASVAPAPSAACDAAVSLRQMMLAQRCARRHLNSAPAPCTGTVCWRKTGRVWRAGLLLSFGCRRGGARLVLWRDLIAADLKQPCQEPHASGMTVAAHSRVDGCGSEARIDERTRVHCLSPLPPLSPLIPEERRGE